MVVFDNKCDIEVIKNNEFFFYQIKTKKLNYHFTIKEISDKGKKINSILGKIYLLKKNNFHTSLFIVSNVNLYFDKKHIIETDFSKFDTKITELISKYLKNELKIEKVDLSNIFYIYDESIHLTEMENIVIGYLVNFFNDIKKEDLINPKALYNLIYQIALNKATYEKNNINDFNTIKNKKSITRNEIDKILSIHSRASKNGIQKTKEYIDKQEISRQRDLNISLASQIEILNNYYYNNWNLKEIKSNVFEYIKNNINVLENEKIYLNKIKNQFDSLFNIEFSDSDKEIFYILIWNTYIEGGDV